MVARSAAGLKSPKMEVFLDFRSQNGPKSDLIDFKYGGYEHGGVRNVHLRPPKAAGKKQQCVNLSFLSVYCLAVFH